MEGIFQTADKSHRAFASTRKFDMPLNGVHGLKTIAYLSLSCRRNNMKFTEMCVKVALAYVALSSYLALHVNRLLGRRFT